ncbi:MAG: preQ(1) synthase [bacterium]|nr:preQ(1) synthase [bacterium]MDD5757199.1 preQ(1) synthase [bacterium]
MDLREKMKLAKGGLEAKLPQLDVFPNLFKDYKVTISVPEYTSLCPHTALPDFATITIEYIPDKLCVELKSFKYYILGYRNLGISHENAVNRILQDFTAACRPKWAGIKGIFTPRGGIITTVEAEYKSRRNH